jgi:ABC-type thiamine transport system substrate-binding protein
MLNKLIVTKTKTIADVVYCIDDGLQLKAQATDV